MEEEEVVAEVEDSTTKHLAIISSLPIIIIIITTICTSVQFPPGHQQGSSLIYLFHPHMSSSFPPSSRVVFLFCSQIDFET